jgi:hypothetical protein
MGNRITVVATEFKTKAGDTYGYRMYDDYGQTYCNLFDESIMSMPDLEILGQVVDNLDDVSKAMVDHCNEMQQGIMVNDNWYDYDEIKDIIS